MNSFTHERSQTFCASMNRIVYIHIFSGVLPSDEVVSCAQMNVWDYYLFACVLLHVCVCVCSNSAAASNNLDLGQETLDKRTLLSLA